MKASISLVVLAMATFGMGAAIESRQSSWVLTPVPLRRNAKLRAKLLDLQVYSASDCNNAWVNCACN
ncbi:hypothetical protein H4I96_08348 [Botrytis cinerea]